MKHVGLRNSDSLATVDEGDYEALAGSEWWLMRKGAGGPYAYRTVGHKVESMSNAILGTPPEGMVWDHRNGNGLDNRRANLRPATAFQNARNARKKYSPSSSRFKGVRKRAGRWSASIRLEGREVRLGSFSDEAEAARAYDRAARQHFGEFACVNFPAGGRERGC